MKIREGVYKTDLGTIYDFSHLDNDKGFQEYLNMKLENHPEEVDIEKCKEGMRLFLKRFPLR